VHPEGDNPNMVVKSVRQRYVPDERTFWLLDQFRQMLNECIQIGLKENVTSLKSLATI
jgi:hypothetical protein